ncbi:MAG: hypothetical protein GAK28_00122 [Luteibacter sp.]|uniref:hypothetical protein n=1 Tax=Luteibacter sp. TaxID=1886636 RepID=UPI0013824EDF|nr:hypothetical protein [Luteibacter sp.]KAF1009484.1 MAG: hypothetical protein GAK28_00122 [Luteibacter sp.]
MTQIVQQGAINTTALIVPDLYVQIVPPQTSQLNGVPTNVLGIVGTATWGPVNAPTVFGNMADFARQFGALQNRKYDLGTAVAIAVQQGANNIVGVRVTDGTDTAASVALSTNITFTSKYTGTLGNSASVQIATGSAANSWKAIVSMPGQVAEVFDNITGTGAAFWSNLAAAINNGQYGLRGPSNMIVATAGAGTTAPSASTNALTGGTDGATTINAAVLVGVDTSPRKGMYALRGAGASVAMLADVDDLTTWTTQVAYGLSEGTYMICTGPAGDTIANAVTTRAAVGVDSYAFKPIFGDYCYWADPVNGVTRLVSPQAFCAGRLANLAPQHSSLNKALYGIVGTQKTSQNLTYSVAELQTLISAGWDVITNPVPGGNYFGMRVGHNGSSNPATQGDNYTRMTNYIASTIGAAMGKFVGRLQTTAANDPLRAEVKATLDATFQAMQDAKQIDTFSNQCDQNNNPPAQVAAGNLRDDTAVRYQSVAEKFLVNMQGGQTVVTRANAPT